MHHSMRKYVLAGVGLMLALLAAVGLLLWLERRGALGADAFGFLLILGVAAAGGAAVILVWRAAVRLVEPLRDVAHALDRAASGDFETELPAAAESDLAELAVAYDSMRRSLRSSIVSRDYLDRLLSNMSEAIFVANPSGKIERANLAAHEMLGLQPGELVGRPISVILASSDGESLRPAPRLMPRDARFVKSDGSPLNVSYTMSEMRDERGEIECLVYAVQNIDERKRAEHRIRYLACVDSLTKLANRMQFQHLLQQAIARAKKAQQYVALLYLDVDRFKDINDTFGHVAGDTSLEIFARRLQAELPENATAGRLAGDEFAVLVSGSGHLDRFMEDVSALAASLVRSVGRSFQVHGAEIFMTTSIGIALYPKDGDNVIDLIRNADAALYQSKKAGGNWFEYYSIEMNTAAIERLMLKNKLRRAFERDELRLHYQPKYNVKTGRIEGAEALVRWDLPERGLVYPSDFIPLAEETNLILQIGDWVLNRVCEDYRDWQRLMPAPCRVSLNLSLRQLMQQRFLERVRETFRAHGVSPTCLELEITETTLMDDAARTVRILDALYGMGLHLAIDDFGTGYSSLSALQQFPISTLKIDQSFIRDVAIDRDNASIVTTIIQMGHNLNLDVVAEGVESEEQLEFLRAHSCDYVQGHLFGDPVTADRFGEMLLAEREGTGQYRALFARA
ncbi:MAG TPA: EAL domain-containing protein [Gammaproteobacteria bacterium]|nr:EAL domain-containing protein [Gammaproteobacteria bacterium]